MLSADEDVQPASAPELVDSKPSVSVIIPVYNAAKYLRKAVESALAQSYPLREVIVVNDGSMDDSLSLLRDFGDKIRLINQPHSGASVARNTAVRESQGKYLAFLDADDVWDRYKIERQVQILESYPECIVTYCDHRIIDKDDHITGKSGATGHLRASGQILKCLLEGNPIISPSTTLVRRDAFEKVGGFDQTVRLGEDHDLWLRLSLTGSFLYQLETLASYRRHTENKYQGPSLERSISKMNRIKDIIRSLASLGQTEFRPACEDALLRATLNIAWQYRVNRRLFKAFNTHLQAIRLQPTNLKLYVVAFKSLVFASFSAQSASKHRSSSQV